MQGEIQGFGSVASQNHFPGNVGATTCSSSPALGGEEPLYVYGDSAKEG